MAHTMGLVVGGLPVLDGLVRAVPNNLNDDRYRTTDVLALFDEAGRAAADAAR